MEVTEHQPRWRHGVRFYRHLDFIAQEAANHLATGLRRGDAALAIVRPALAAKLMRRLCADGLARQTQKLILLDAQKTLDRFMLDGWPDEALFRAALEPVVQRCTTQGRALSAFGEMVTLLCEQGHHDAAARLEEMWNALGQQYGFHLLCAYPLRLFADRRMEAAFRHVCNCHGEVAPTELVECEMGAPQGMTLALLEQKTLAMERLAAEHEVLMQQRRAERAAERDYLAVQGQAALHRGRCSVPALFRRTVALVEPLLEQREQQVATDVPCGDVWIDADAERLTEALSLLLLAASRSAPRRARARLEMLASDASMVRFWIGCDAPPAPPQELDAAPELATSPPVDLAAARALIDLHGGSISRLSGVPAGAAFVVRLPQQENASVGAGAAARHGRVLVVHEDRDTAGLLSEMMSLSGWQALVAHDADDALEALDTFSPDLAVVHTGERKKVDGYALARSIRSHPSAASCRLLALVRESDVDHERMAESGFETLLIR